jgi:hypothetical protein
MVCPIVPLVPSYAVLEARSVPKRCSCEGGKFVNSLPKDWQEVHGNG